MFHQGPIAAVASSGSYIVTAGYDNQVILWDATRRASIARSVHDHLVNYSAFNSTGTLVVSASSDYSARIWEIPSLRLRASLIGHTDDVDMAVFSPDDLFVATCALDRTIRIFDLSGDCLKILRGHRGNIISLAWGSDSSRLVSSSVDGTVREWDALSGEEIRCNDIDGVRTDTIVIDADGRIFAGDDDGRIVTISNGVVSYFSAHRAGIKRIIYNQAKRILATLSYDRTIAIWRVSDNAEISELSRGPIPPLVWARAATFIGNSKIAVGTFGTSYGIFDWNEKSWDLDGVVAARGLNAVAVIGERQYAIGDAGTLICDGIPTTPLGSLCNFLLPVGKYLFAGGQLGTLFNSHSGAVLYQHYSPLNCGASFIRDGENHIVIGTYTGEMLIFRVGHDGSASFVTELKAYDAAVKGVVASEELIFSVCASTDIAWHSTATFELKRYVSNAHERIANGCCLAGPNDFASIGRDRKLRIWTSDRVDTYETPHPNSVKCICASDDRNTLVTGAYTGTIASFDMSTRTWTSFSRPTASGISALAFDARLRRFLASSYDGQIYAIPAGGPQC